MIDFTFTEQQIAMKEAARKFAQGELKPLVKELEHLSDPWECFRRTRDVYRKAAKLGLTRGFIPVEYGGGRVGKLHSAGGAGGAGQVRCGLPFHGVLARLVSVPPPLLRERRH